jgi:hypothetical protein
VTSISSASENRAETDETNPRKDLRAEGVMMTAALPNLQSMATDGFLMLHAVFGSDEVDTIIHGLGQALSRPEAESSIRSQAGSVYAARNVLALWPPTSNVWRVPPLPALLEAILGPEYGLVRALFFDKPPDQTWALPWHKDLTIAVCENRLRSAHFSKPTRKAAVPHVEAPQEILERMLTARIHLDDVTKENGPLRVIPGSHRQGKALHLGDVPPCTVLAGRGDVLLLRPLVAHCSNRSHPETQRHRRILHLEFAGCRELRDGYAWHDYIVGRTAPSQDR